MFNIFKKKQVNNRGDGQEAEEGQELSAVEQEDEVSAEDMNKNIAIHVMPERFRVTQGQADKTKTMGMLIMVGGAMFLIVGSFLLYFYLFKKQPTGLKPPALIEEASIAEKTAERKKISGGTTEKTEEKKPEARIEIVRGTEKTATTSQELLETEDIERATTTVATTTEETNVFVMGVDSDGDGLTDKEEAIFGSSIGNTDSDEDGYNDREEVINLYQPVGSGKLEESMRVARYINKTFKYNLLHPVGWPAKNVQDDDSIIFSVPDNQFIQVIAQHNQNRQPIDDWFKLQFERNSINESKRVSALSWQGIKNDDDLTIYLTDNAYNYIFTITYNLGYNNMIMDYRNIFEMMIKSFEIR